MSPLWRAPTRRPTARTAELVVEQLGDELLVYDQRNDQVHCLSSGAGTVWRACDGQTSIEEVASALEMESELVERALAELEGCGLLEAEAAGGVTRREAATRLAKMGAAAATAPLIYSIAAPPPAMARTPCGTGSLGCIGFSASKGGLCTKNVAGQCYSAGCACCYVSPNQCLKQSWAACITACGVCNQAYVLRTCPDAACPGGNASGCQAFP